ncbi:DUF2213 domain-containing protein [Neisseria lactamica]|uniref:DUF2213 domain-containing protein n=1 Tax=Neisseria lactamica TaxID=486 RepID=UPI000E56DB45|nr:DUF2213 domain-containing protein [Neisseria lactamica]
MNTQQRTILSKARRLSAMDAEWDESKHPRAENGRFGSGSLKDGKVNFPELSVSEIEALAKTPIAVTSEMGQGARKSAVKEWLRSNLQGKSVTASDGNRIYFTRNDTVSHISFNSQRSHLIAQCVPHLAAVFAEGEAVGFQESSHDRKDKSIIGFQVYRKQITLADGYQVRIEAHAAKREEGYLEFAAYTLKKAPASDGYSSTDIAENSTRIPDSPPDARAGVKDNRSGADDSGEAVRHVEYGLSSADNHTPAQNQMQGCEYAAYADKKIDSKSKKVGNAPASIETAKDSGQAAGFVSYADNHTHFAEDGQAHETFEYAAYAHKKIDSKSEKGSQNLHANDAADSIRKLEFGSTAFKANPTPAADSAQEEYELFRIMKITDQNGRDVTKTYDEDRLSIAQDRSLRSYDQDGRLHVESSNISKATVNPYYGGEIPNYRQLGLEPKKVYYLLRDPEELEKAAPTFNNLPLLNKHIPVSADEPQKEVIAGTTGSDTVFEDGYLKCSLAVWDAEAIAGIESGEQVELSSAYHYTADMTAGEFEGRHYDGVMRDIVGNHVALVDVGRAGRDVVVSDADPFNKKENTMKLKAGAKARIQAAVQPLLAQDAELSPDELLQVIGSLTDEVKTAQDDGKELPPENVENVGTDGDDSDDGENNTAPAEDEEPEKTAEDEAPEAPEGGAPKPAQDAAISKMAMDAAIQKAVAAERKRAQALAAAQREVAHIVGDVAMDNAADVYKFALEQSGIDVTGVHPSAYRAMVGMLGKPKQPMAQDMAKTAEQFPSLSRIRKA